MNIKDLYKKIVYSNRFLKLARAFHYEKFFCKQFLPDKNTRCLLLCPHPDDETFGCGGLLLQYPENFDIICLTDGRFGGHNQPEEEIIKIRKEEFKQCMNKLNITSFRFLDIKDRKLIYNYPVFESIEFDNYDYIFIPNYFDQHKDHKAVTTLLQKSFLSKKYKKSVRIVFYEVWAALAFPNYYVDISKIIEQKKELINIYSSQTKYVDFLEGICSLNRYRGILVNTKYAECFSILDIDTFMKL